MASKEKRIEKRIIIVQPQLTLTEGGLEQARRMPENVFYQIVQGDLQVTGELVVDVSGEVAVPLDFTSWNWPVKANNLPPFGTGQFWSGKYSFFLKSDHPSPAKLSLGFTTCANVQEYMDLMLHLAMRQMVPTLSRTADLIDLAVDPEVGKVQGAEKKHQVAELGFLAVAYDCLYGTVAHSVAQAYSLGFQVRPGLDTYAGCKGWDRWLQHLVWKKQDQMYRVSTMHAGLLLGPKPLFS